MQAALVKLVDHDGHEIGEERILLQSRGQDAFGCHQQASLSGRAPVEAHVPADLPAERPATFLGDPPSDGPRRHSTRLQQEHRTIANERRRHPRRLASTWRRSDHHRARSANGVDDLRNVRVNRQLIHAIAKERSTAARRVGPDGPEASSVRPRRTPRSARA